MTRSIVLATCALALILSVSSATAANPGDPIKLGVVNTINALTTLSGVTPAGQLSVRNTDPAGYALRAATSGDNANAVYGLHSSTSGQAAAVRGDSASSAAGAFAVFGLLSSTSAGADSAAVRGRNDGTGVSGFGVYGSHAGSGIGVYGSSLNGEGVRGRTTGGTAVRGISGSGVGVRGESASTAASSAAVVGELTATNGGGNSAGVRGINDSQTAFGIGVFGSQAGSGWGVYGQTPNGRGVFGYSVTGEGVRGDSDSGTGVVGAHTTSTNNNPGVLGTTDSTFPISTGVMGELTPTSPGFNSAGVRGIAGSTNGQGFGVLGRAAQGAAGVYGSSDSGYGVHGKSTNSWGGYFEGGVFVQGNVSISGTLTASVKNFRIDHPLDPSGKYLQHASVESDELLDVYSGNARTDGKGFATVKLPRWFQALNSDFRYQLTPIGKLVLAAVIKPLAHNRFTIQTSKPNVHVSWQVTAVRHDRYARTHPLQVVVPK